MHWHSTGAFRTTPSQKTAWRYVAAALLLSGEYTIHSAPCGTGAIDAGIRVGACTGTDTGTGTMVQARPTGYGQDGFLIASIS